MDAVWGAAVRVDGEPRRTLWVAADGWAVEIIDQTQLPHRFATLRLTNVAEAEHAIRSMQVRGAPLIGATAAYGLALAARHDPSDAGLEKSAALLLASRPTAVNLRWALERMLAQLLPCPAAERVGVAYAQAAAIVEDDVATCRRIGEHGAALIESVWRREQRPVQVLTHCNAGWLATIDWGTALAPIYVAAERGVPLHVWVDETRPRNQGASLTAWELGKAGVPHTLIVDNVGGHLMQHGRVDLCIVGADRVTRRGDVCNKVGTYLKALAAHDNRVPFYAAVPHSTLDWSLADGVAEIPIEERGADEVLWMQGRMADGTGVRVLIAPDTTPAANFGFDVTPARLVTGIITERGVCPATEQGLRALYPEQGS